MKRTGDIAKRFLIGVLPFVLGGCILGGRLDYYLIRDALNQLEVALSADAAVLGCEVTDAAVPGETVTRTAVVCTYYVGDILNRSYVDFFLSNALLFVLDPMVVQVPVGVTGIRGTYAGPGGSGNLQVTEVGGTLRADVNTNFVPEPGYKLVVLDFPTPSPVIDGRSYTLNLTFSAANVAPPISIKALFAGKVTVGGASFYPPLLPCETDFANVPALSLSLADAFSPVNIAPAMSAKPCDGTTYSFVPGFVATVIAVEYYNATLDHYFMTWRPAEQAKLDAGETPTRWTRTGNAFAAFPTASATTSPVCRYYIPPGKGDSHFFGRGMAECDATSAMHPDFVLEQTDFMHVYLPVAGACPAATRPVYRVFSNRPDANHRYMTSRALRDQMVTQGWVAEGDGPDRVAMCAPV